eukprot:jgi/Bigna1/129991/aug1.10_g4699
MRHDAEIFNNWCENFGGFRLPPNTTFDPFYSLSDKKKKSLTGLFLDTWSDRFGFCTLPTVTQDDLNKTYKKMERGGHFVSFDSKGPVMFALDNEKRCVLPKSKN